MIYFKAAGMLVGFIALALLSTLILVSAVIGIILLIEWTHSDWIFFGLIIFSVSFWPMYAEILHYLREKENPGDS